MARYVDGDALKTDILKKYKQNWEVPCSYEDRIIQRVVTDLRVLIEQNIPADVAPKSEVAREIFGEIKKAIKEEVLGYCNCFEKAEFPESREYYKTKQDTAIFLYMKIDHLEKKYAEERE